MTDGETFRKHITKRFKEGAAPDCIPVNALYSFLRAARPLSTAKTMLDGRKLTLLGDEEVTRPDKERQRERTLIKLETLGTFSL